METNEATAVYPTEPVSLPSAGVFYPENSPLHSGTIELRYMTAQSEDILTSSNLIAKGIVIDRLLDSLIATKGVTSADLLIGDLNAVMVAARILGYGKDYEVTVQCPVCKKVNTQVVDLTKLATVNEPDINHSGEFFITLPLSKVVVGLKLLTRKNEFDIEKEVKMLKKTNGGIETDTTSRLRAMIKSVNGDTSPTAIWKVVENMLVRDAKYLREEYRKIVPDVNFDVPVECDCDGDDDLKVARLPMGTDFFWPES